jgi:hypothetical protein
MRQTPLPTLIQQKLDAFEAIQPAFIASFEYVQAIHGQRRFGNLSIADAVLYLVALYISECKDRLLSIPRTIRRYRGEEALRLLDRWQAGEIAAVVSFLTDRLDSLPLAQISQEIAAAQQEPDQAAQAQRLIHGRQVVLNRGMHLMLLVHSISAQPERDAIIQAREACISLGYTPERIARALADFATRLYAFVPHQALAQRNMLVMNVVGRSVLDMPADLPGDRTWRVLPATETRTPFAEIPIPAYTELTAPFHNNLRGVRFVDIPDPLMATEILMPGPEAGTP